MKNLIFSIYAPIQDSTIRLQTFFDNDAMSKSQRTHEQFKKYKNKLIEVKKSYAKLCGADFILVDRVDKHFFDDEFDSINFYKHHLIEKFCNKYDNILYLDFDVIPNTTESFFEKHDMNVINVHAVDATKQNTWHKNAKHSKKDYRDVMNKHFDRYHMYCKAKCKLAMLLADDTNSSDHNIANTAIIGGSNKSLSQIQMTKRLAECQQSLQVAVKENMFGEEITQYFFANNETFYSYILDKHNIKWNNLPTDWHTMIKNQYDYGVKHQLYNAKFIHMINKNFEVVWGTDV